MTLEEIWFAHFRAIVDKEAQAAGGDLREGYRRVANTIVKSVEYIYQLYQGKPKADGSPRKITLKFSQALARHYAEGRPLDWINEPPTSGSIAREAEPDASASGKASVAPIATWPFKEVSYRRFMALPREAQREIDEYLDSMVLRWEQKLSKSSGPSKRR